MKTKPIPKTPSREQMERNTLRLLCSVLVKPGTRLEIYTCNRGANQQWKIP